MRAAETAYVCETMQTGRNQRAAYAEQAAAGAGCGKREFGVKLADVESSSSFFTPLAALPRRFLPPCFLSPLFPLSLFLFFSRLLSSPSPREIKALWKFFDVCPTRTPLRRVRAALLLQRAPAISSPNATPGRARALGFPLCSIGAFSPRLTLSPFIPLDSSPGDVHIL